MSCSVAKQTSELNLLQRVLSASVGAVLTSLLVTPLDVVKTRMQAQGQQLECLEAKSPASCARCTHFAFHNGLIDVMLPKATNPTAFNCPHQFTGTFDALFKITKFEGFGALYNGLRPSLIMAVPSTVLYFASYDKLRVLMLDRNWGDTLSPLIAGSSARTIAATVISPLELIRTKMQAVNNPQSMFRVARTQIRMNGVLSLWQGLSPTLFRDVPFSAIYWVIVERTKPIVRPIVAATAYDYDCESVCRSNSLEEFVVSFIAGATGGFVAATVTNPFDVVKTRRQVFDYATNLPEAVKAETSNLSIMKRVFKTEGIAGFFVGLVPRLGKIMPACAIMLSSYEAGKKYFLQVSSS